MLSRLTGFSDLDSEVSGGGEPVSDIGLTSRSSRDGLRGLNPDGCDLFFHGVDPPLLKIAVRLSGLDMGVLLDEAGY